MKKWDGTPLYKSFMLEKIRICVAQKDCHQQYRNITEMGRRIYKGHLPLSFSSQKELLQ